MLHVQNVQFAPASHMSDSISKLGPPEVVTAQLEMTVDDGGKGHLLSTLELRAVVGVARLSVPKSLRVKICGWVCCTPIMVMSFPVR